MGIFLCLFVFLVLIPLLTDLTQCFEEASKRQETISEKQLSGELDDEHVCLEIKNDLELVRECTDKARQKSILPRNVVDLINNWKGVNLEKAVQEHNQVCGQYPSAEIRN